MHTIHINITVSHVDTQQCMILSALLIHSAQCVPYEGNVCNSVLENISIPQPPTSVAVEDAIIRKVLNSTQMVLSTEEGDDFTTECKNIVLFANCINSFKPCRGKVWCLESTASDLQEMVQSKCSNRRLQQVLQASSLDIYKAGQTPPNTTCQVVELGEQLQNMIIHFCTHVYL